MQKNASGGRAFVSIMSWQDITFSLSSAAAADSAWVVRTDVSSPVVGERERARGRKLSAGHTWPREGAEGQRTYGLIFHACPSLASAVPLQSYGKGAQWWFASHKKSLSTPCRNIQLVSKSLYLPLKTGGREEENEVKRRVDGPVEFLKGRNCMPQLRMPRSSEIPDSQVNSNRNRNDDVGDAESSPNAGDRGGSSTRTTGTSTRSSSSYYTGSAASRRSGTSSRSGRGLSSAGRSSSTTSSSFTTRSTSASASSPSSGAESSAPGGSGAGQAATASAAPTDVRRTSSAHSRSGSRSIFPVTRY